MSHQNHLEQCNQNDAFSIHEDEVQGASRQRQKQVQHQAQPPVASRKSDAPPEVSVSLPLSIIPEEVIVEVLLRLPVKSLLRFRCICKSWKSLISDPQFVKKHHHISSTDVSLTHHRFVSAPKRRCTLQSLFNNPSNSEVEVCEWLNCDYRIVGSCNGLLCLSERSCDYVHLYNPSTRWISEKSPPILDLIKDIICDFMLFGFGYDCVTDKYKVVAVHWDVSFAAGARVITVVKIYTLGSGSWKQIEKFPHFPLIGDNSGTFVSGTLNWLATWVEMGSHDRLTIVSLEMGEETYKQVLLPVDFKYSDYAEDYAPTIGILRDCLCFSYECSRSEFVVWVMNEYGVEQSWTKMVTISYQGLGVNVGRLQYPMPLFMSENGQVLLQTRNDELVLYRPTDNSVEFPETESFKSCWHPKIYVESLVSPE